MALNILTTPQALTPAYNQILFTFSGSNYNQIGYRYVVDIYNGNTNARISRQQVAPLPDGSGKIDISRIISNYVDVDFTGSTNTIANASNSYFNYYIKLGETYKSPVWTFLLTSSQSLGTTILVSASGTTNSYVVGDQIDVKTNTVLGNNFSGLYVAKAPITLTSVTIANVWDTQNHTGTTVYADGRKVVFANLVTSSGYTAFNGVKSFDDFINWSGNNYTLSAQSTTNLALTNLPNNFYATKTQDIKIDAYINKLSGWTYQIYSLDNYGANYNTNIMSGAGNIKQVSQFNIGYKVIFPTEPPNQIKYYDNWITRYSGVTVEFISKPYRVYVDARCAINNYEVAFQDRMGSISSFAFQLRSNDTGNVTRTQYKQQVNDTYTTENRGTKNIFIALEKSLELNTNWMTDEMSVYFEELITSPYSWIKLDDGKYHACIVKETSFEIERQKNKRLIRKTVSIQLANNDSINC